MCVCVCVCVCVNVRVRVHQFDYAPDSANKSNNATFQHFCSIFIDMVIITIWKLVQRPKTHTKIQHNFARLCGLVRGDHG